MDGSTPVAAVTEFPVILFDMDGVLVQSEPLHFEADAVVMARYGVTLDPKSMHEFFGASENETFSTLVDRYSLNQSPESLIEEKEAVLLEMLENNLVVFPKATEILTRLQPVKRLALVTSTRRPVVDWTLEVCGWEDIFSSVITANDVSRHKPDPMPYQVALTKMACQPEEAMVIEDTPRGIEAAKSAGLYTVALAQTFPRSDLDEADAVFDTLAAFGRVVLGSTF